MTTPSVTEEMQCDVCVVGAGPAGAIVALELAADGNNVLLLEAGADTQSTDTLAAIGNINVSGNANLQFGRAFQIGGSSNLWAGRVAPFEEIDFEPRPWMAQTAWPFRRTALDEGYAKAFSLLGMNGLPNIAIPPKIKAFQSMLDDGLEVKSFAWSRPPFNIGHLVRERMNKSGGPRVLTNTVVTALRETDNATSIDSVDARTANGGSLNVKARLFVLASGGLEVPRLMLASTGVRVHGVGNDHDLVGRYFSTHPKADMAALVLKKSVAINNPVFSDQKVGSVMARAGIGLTPQQQRTHELPNHYVQLSPLFEFRAGTVFDKVKSSRVVTSPLIEQNKLLRSLVPALGLFAYEAIGRLAGLQLRARTFVLRGFLDQIPNSENRVMLSNELDGNGVPSIDIAWKLSEGDRSSVLRFFELLDSSFRKQNLGHIEFGGLRTSGDWPITAIHSHFMGATRMGNDPKTGVVDADCKVFGSSNLYVAGPSVFPTYGYSNPFLTIAALSYRLADHLKHVMREPLS